MLSINIKRKFRIISCDLIHLSDHGKQLNDSASVTKFQKLKAIGLLEQGISVKNNIRIFRIIISCFDHLSGNGRLVHLIYRNRRHKQWRAVHPKPLLENENESYRLHR
tara:strand:- start:3249 stop:3572 length:324 start_codon:yes stop_codon:yes gene_type:complete